MQEMVWDKSGKYNNKKKQLLDNTHLLVKQKKNYFDL